MATYTLADLLGTTEAFGGLDLDSCQRVASFLTEQRLVTGEVLARQGDLGDAMYVVVEGTIGFTRLNRDSAIATYLGKIGPGGIIGELGLLTGHPRSATMAAEEGSIVARLSRADFDTLCLEFPQQMESVIAWMRRRLHGYQIKTALDESPLLKNLSAEVKSELEQSFQWLELRSGETLFREGDRGDALYLIVSGRIRLSQLHDTQEGRVAGFMSRAEQTLTELRKGDTLGEMALLTNEPRSATAVAVRDTQLAYLNHAEFDRIVAVHPKELLEAFVCQMAGRLREQNLGRNSSNAPPVSIAVLVSSPLTKDFARQLANGLSAFGRTIHLSRASLSEFSSDRAIAADAAEVRLLSWLNDQEARYQHVVYEADLIEEPWTFRCLRQADVLFLAVEAKADISSVTTQLQAVLQRAKCRVPPILIFHHTDPNVLPAHTRAWLNKTQASRHFHLRVGVAEDVSRVVRALTGRSIGLTLGGGFAFGLAHIGVIQALREMNIPVDYTGGTSMGAIIGMACAANFSRELMLEILQKGCANSLKGDYTFPIVSLLTGRKVARSIGFYVGDIDIEDLWLPYFAVSASLVYARMVIHTEGNALRSLLASCRAPLMFPPLGWNDDVLVDGGLVNNVPCDIMRDKVGPGTVIAVDVSPENAFSVREQFDLHLSGWKVARRKVNLFSRQPKPATIADIIARLVRFGGVAQLRQIRSSADLYLLPPLTQFTFRDFHLGREMAQIGYDYARAEVQQWIDRYGKPWTGNAEASRRDTLAHTATF